MNLISLGMSLPPIRGTWYFVNPNATGTSDAGMNQFPGSNNNVGIDPLRSLADINAAYGKCVDGRGDGICLLSSGTSTAHTTSYLSAAITWSKAGITTFGVGAPTRFSQRARIANASTALTLANLITVSGDNNAFYNFSAYNGGTTGAGGVMVSGKRNYFYNTHLMGGMGMTTPTITDYSLYLSGSQENTFERCTIGSDTFDKTDIAGAEMLVGGGCERDRFIDCEFISFRSAGTTAGMIKLVGGDCVTRSLIFNNCQFHMYRDGAVTAEAAVVIGTSPNNGFVLFDSRCGRHGFTDWAGVATARVFSLAATAHESGGLYLAANPS